MTYGQAVARDFKRQYCHKGKWDQISGWEYQPHEIYTVLLELRTLKAIHCLLDKSWTRGLQKKMRSREVSDGK